MERERRRGIKGKRERGEIGGEREKSQLTLAFKTCTTKVDTL